MRILNVQNFAANALSAVDKCCKPRKLNDNNGVKNNLERSPMQDTVSFGRFGGRYAELAKDYVWMKLLSNIDAYDKLNECIYVSIEPTEETIVDPSKKEYSLKLVSYRDFRPNDTEKNIQQIDRVMQGRVEDFNKFYDYESGWEKHLTTTEDFEKAAELADYLNDNGFFRSDDTHDPMSDMAKWCYNHLAQ